MTVLAALATAVRERLAAGHDAPLPGFGTLRRQHVPARVQTQPDGGRVLLPPSETIRFSQDATDPTAVAAALARTQDLPAAAGATALSDAVDQLEAIVVATGEARLPGVGLFRRTSSSVIFATDTTLLTEINRPYAGLGPVEAAPAPSVEQPPPEEPPSAHELAASDLVPEEVETPAVPSAPPEESVEVLRHGLAASAPLSGLDASVELAAADSDTLAEPEPDAWTLTPDALRETSPAPDREEVSSSTLPLPAADPFAHAPLTSPTAGTKPASLTDDEPLPPSVPVPVQPVEAPAPDLSSAADENESADSSPYLSLDATQPADPEGDVALGHVVPNEDTADVHEAPTGGATAEREADFEAESESGPSPEAEPEDALDSAPPADSAAPDTTTEPKPRRRRSPDAESDPLGGFLDSVLPIGTRKSRRRTRRAARAASAAGGLGAIGAAMGTASEAPSAGALPTETLPTVEPEAEAFSLNAPDAADGEVPGEPVPSTPVSLAPGDEWSDEAVEEITGPPVFAPPPAPPDWSADAGASLPDVDLSLGEDLDEDDFGDLDPDDLAAPAEVSTLDASAPDAPTAGASVLDDIYATDRDQPLSDSDSFIGSDLGAASSSATALGLGLTPAAPGQQYRRRATDRDPETLAPAPATPPLPVADGGDRWFSFGSLLLLAVSLAAIAAAATWPRIAGPPPTPAPTAGRGAFGDTLGDAAEAAIRERQALSAVQDSTAAPDADVLADPDAPRPTTPAAPAPTAPGTESTYESVEVTPETVPAAPPTAAPAERRTLGVAPPSGTAILPPRVAGLPQGQSRALASRDGISRGNTFTWVVLSSPGRDEANALAQRYRGSGYRAGVVATTAAGRTTYRVGVGQYGSRDDAQTLRQRLPPQAPADTWLLDLSSSGLSF